MALKSLIIAHLFSPKTQRGATPTAPPTNASVAASTDGEGGAEASAVLDGEDAGEAKLRRKREDVIRSDTILDGSGRKLEVVTMVSG